MAALRKHAGFLLLLLSIAPLVMSFALQDGIATLGDDSVSYVTLARHYSGSIGAALLPWVPFQNHFPPLFPALLAVTGGGDSLRIGHGVVAFFAIVGVAMVYWYGMLRFARRGPALALVALFVLTPSAWISIKGILSESLFLAVSLAAICVYEWRLARDRRSSAIDWAVFGLLVSLAWLTRQMGWALIVAYALHAGIRMIRTPSVPRWSLATPLIVWAVVAGAWTSAHSAMGSGEHQRYMVAMLQAWSENPGLLLLGTAKILATAWIATFTADAEVSAVPRVLVGMLGLLAVAGALRRAIGNHLDGWYVLVSLAVTCFYIMHEGDTRRVLYSILPLLLAHAAGLVLELADRPSTPRHQKLLLFAFGLVPPLVCLPALLVILQKSRDTMPFVPGGHAARDITDYYTTLNANRARALAARHALVLDGLENLKRATPLDARIMWIRPEYVALLGERRAVPFYLAWNERELAQAIRDSETSHVVLATLFKSDLHNARGDPSPAMRKIFAYAEPVFTLRNPVTGGEEFTLLKVDRGRLDAYLGKSG